MGGFCNKSLCGKLSPKLIKLVGLTTGFFQSLLTCLPVVLGKELSLYILYIPAEQHLSVYSRSLSLNPFSGKEKSFLLLQERMRSNVNDKTYLLWIVRKRRPKDYRTHSGDHLNFFFLFYSLNRAEYPTDRVEFGEFSSKKDRMPLLYLLSQSLIRSGGV